MSFFYKTRKQGSEKRVKKEAQGSPHGRMLLKCRTGNVKRGTGNGERAHKKGKRRGGKGKKIRESVMRSLIELGFKLGFVPMFSFTRSQCMFAVPSFSSSLHVLVSSPQGRSLTRCPFMKYPGVLLLYPG